MSERYIPVQHRTDHDTSPFIIWSGPAVNKTDAIIIQDGGRSIDLLQYTLMAIIHNEQKWTTFTNPAETDGTAHPQGIYMGPDILAADIVAADIDDAHILVTNAHFDAEKLVIEGGHTLETIIGVGTTDKRSVKDHLRTLGLIARPTSSSSGPEN